MFNSGMRFPKPRIPSPVPTARRAQASAAERTPDAPRHRFMIETTDFTNGNGTPITDYAILSYGTSAADAAQRALDIITARYRPAVAPTVTKVTCDHGCIDRNHP